MENRTLYVGNLSYNVSEDELLDLFDMGSNFVKRARIAKDRETGNSRGFAFVDFVSEYAAKLALGTLEGVSLDNRAIRLRFAEPRQS